MADKPWFTNRGQIMQTVSAVCSAVCAAIGVLVALYVNLPGVFQAGVGSVAFLLSVLIIPTILVGGFNIVFYFMKPSLLKSIEGAKTEGYPSQFFLTTNQTAKPTVQEHKAPIDFGAALPPKTESEVLDVKIKIGSYWEKSAGLDRFRISVLGVQGDPGKLTVDLSVTSGGSVFHAGSEVKAVSVNRFLVPESRSGFQSEERCVYQFSFSENHVHFCAARVDGVDLHHQEVAVNIVKLRTMSVPAL